MCRNTSWYKCVKIPDFSSKVPHEEDNEFEKEILQQENKEMREEIASLNGKIARLQEAMKRKEKEQFELGKLSHGT
ncbi:UNVERIFIED_CONTAM: hypothetical protein K2H54_026847 [Gekko kuhli]